MAAQNHDDFSKAREILNVQEELSQRISLIQKMLSYSGVEAEELDVGIDESEEDGTNPSERPDYSLYAMDDTVAYDIEDTSVTFKRPAAF